MATKYAVIRQALPATISSTVDFTESGFGTPTGVLFFYDNPQTTSNPAPQARPGFGFYDGTNQRSMSVESRDAVGTTITRRYNSTARTVAQISDTDLFAGFDASFITDGVRLTMDADATAVLRYCTAVLFGGDVACDCGTLTVNATQNGTAAVTSLSSEPDVVLVCCTGQTAQANDTHNILTWGCVVNDGSETQRMIALSSVTNVGTSNSSMEFATDRCGGQWHNNARSWAAELTAFAADGFTITTRDGASGGDEIYWMALDLGGDLSWLGTLTTPTSAGNDSIATPGFTPKLLLPNCGYPKTSTASHIAYSFGATDGTTSSSSAGRDEDNLSTSDSSSTAQLNVMNMIKVTDGTDDIVADFVSFDTNGRTYDFTTVDASNARLGWELAIGAAAPAAGTKNLTLLGVG